MQVKIRFFTSLREVTGKKEQTLTFPPTAHATVDLALKMLSKEYGKPFTEYVYDVKTGLPKGFLQFLVNGSACARGLETELCEGDVLAILPPVGGG